MRSPWVSKPILSQLARTKFPDNGDTLLPSLTTSKGIHKMVSISDLGDGITERVLENQEIEMRVTPNGVKFTMTKKSLTF